MPDKAGSVTLRPATDDDQPFLLQVYGSTRSDELAGLGWDDTQKQAFIRMQFDAQTRCYPKADTSVILLDGWAVGRMMVARSESEIHLVDVALLTQFRNSGIGTKLMEDLLAEAAANDKPVRLHVFAANPAVRLYERLNFSRIGADETYLEMIWVSPQSGSH